LRTMLFDFDSGQVVEIRDPRIGRAITYTAPRADGFALVSAHAQSTPKLHLIDRKGAFQEQLSFEQLSGWIPEFVLTHVCGWRPGTLMLTYRTEQDPWRFYLAI